MSKDYEIGGARNSDPGTSHEAAVLVDAAGLRQIVYQVMATFGEDGCIGDEVEDALPDIPINSISPRYAEMEDLGMIIKTGEKRKGGHYNRSQVVRRVLPPPFEKPKRTYEFVHRCPTCGTNFEDAFQLALL